MAQTARPARKRVPKAEEPEVTEEYEPEAPATKPAAPKTALQPNPKDDRPGVVREQERLRKILYG